MIRPSRLPRLGACLFLLGFMAACAGGTEAPPAAVDAYESAVTKARSLAHGILVGIRKLRAEGPPPSSPEAIERMTGIASIRELFEEVEIEARDLEDAARRAAAAHPGDLQERFEKAHRELETYGAYVRKFYSSALQDYGAPPAPPERAGAIPRSAAGIPARVRIQGLRIAGDVTGALGSSSYRRPHADPAVDNSAVLFEGRVDANTRLRSGTRFDARLSRESRVERRGIALTDLGLDVEQPIPNASGLKVAAGISRNWFDDQEDDAADYGETQVRFGIERPQGRQRFDAGVVYRNRSYGESASALLDYSVTTARASTELPFADHRLLASISHTSRDGEAVGGDFSILNPAVTLRLGARGSELHVAAERYQATEDPEGTADTDRLKAHLRLGWKHPGRQGYSGPELLWNRFPNQTDAGHVDFGWAARATGTSRGLDPQAQRRRASWWRAYYRRHERDDAYDFIGFSFRTTRRPLTRGLLAELAVAGRGYVETADYDSIGEVGGNPDVGEIFTALGELVEAFGPTRSPHSLDAFYRLGGVWRQTEGPLRSLEITGSLNHKLYVDSERHRLQEKADDLAAMLPDSLTDGHPLGDVDFLLRNTINRAGWGLGASAEVTPSAGARARVSLRYEQDVLYNADPIQTTSSIDVKMSGDYQLRPDIRLEAYVDLHKVEVGDGDSSQDYSRTEFALRVHYRF